MDSMQNQVTPSNIQTQPDLDLPKETGQPAVSKQQKGIVKKIFILFCIIFFLIIVVLVAIQMFIFAPQKKLLQASINQQIQNFQALSHLNNQIIQLIKENVANDKDAQQMNSQTTSIFLNSIDASPLLSPDASSSSNVKGDQTVDPTAQLQKEIAYDKKGEQITDDIIATDNKINTLYKSENIAFLLPDPQNLIENTTNAATKLKKLFTYEEEINVINVDQVNLNLPFTFAITALFSTGRPDSDTIIAQLKDLMAKTTANEAKVKRLNSMSLPQKLLANQNVEIIAYQQQKQLMDQLFIDYADNNKAGLKKDFTAIVTQPTISDSNSFLSFWQTDDTLTAIETLRNEWNTFGEKF